MAITRLGGANAISGTLPAANINDTSIGNITALPAAIATGKVLQFKQKSLSANFETSSTSYSTVIYDTITPSSTSNKIQIIMDGTFQSYDSASNQSGYSKNNITREIGASSTNLMNDVELMRQYNTAAPSSGGCIIRAWQYISYLDTPNTTSECTYYFRQKADHTSDTCSIITPANLYLVEIEG